MPGDAEGGAAEHGAVEGQGPVRLLLVVHLDQGVESEGGGHSQQLDQLGVGQGGGSADDHHDRRAGRIGRG